MGHRGALLGQNAAARRLQIAGKWTALIALATFLGFGIWEAWNYGIISYAAHIAWLIAVGFWKMLCDVAQILWEFLLVLFHKQT